MVDAERVLRGLDLQRLVRRAERCSAGSSPASSSTTGASRSSRCSSSSASLVCAVRARHDVARPGAARRVRAQPAPLLRPADAGAAAGSPARLQATSRSTASSWESTSPASCSRASGSPGFSERCRGGRPGSRRTGSRRGSLRWSQRLRRCWHASRSWRPPGSSAATTTGTEPTLIDAQRAAERTDGRDLDRLVAIVKARGDGRVYAGLRSNWGRDFVVGVVPVYAWLSDRDVDAIGFTFRTIASLSNDTEAAFDETNPAEYEMFNVRYVILPPDRRPEVRRPASRPAASIASGRWRRAATSRSWTVRRRSRRIARTSCRPCRTSWRSDLASQGDLPGRRVRRRSGAAPDVLRARHRRPGAAGTVLAQAQQARGRRLHRDRGGEPARRSSYSRPRTTRAGP